MVGPFDIDYNLHLNNSKFLSFMDLGRMDMAAKCGILKSIFKNKMQIVAAGVNIMYRKPIPPLAIFKLHTKVLCWDDKWLYMEQDFEHNKKIAARAIIRVGITKKGLLKPQFVFNKLGKQSLSPEIPKYLKEMIQGEIDFAEYVKRSNSEIVE